MGSSQYCAALYLTSFCRSASGSSTLTIIQQHGESATHGESKVMDQDSDKAQLLDKDHSCLGHAPLLMWQKTLPARNFAWLGATSVHHSLQVTVLLLDPQSFDLVNQWSRYSSVCAEKCIVDLLG